MHKRCFNHKAGCESRQGARAREEDLSRRPMKTVSVLAGRACPCKPSPRGIKMTAVEWDVIIGVSFENTPSGHLGRFGKPLPGGPEPPGTFEL